MESVETLGVVFLMLLFVWVIVLAMAIVNLYRRTDIPLPVKIIWGLFIFFAPVLGLICYLVFGGTRARRRRMDGTQFR